MTSIEALRRLEALGGAFSTNDAGAQLDVPPGQASLILGRLERAGHVQRLARGRWTIAGAIHPFAVPEALTAPTPSYVSLQSALHHHGMIEQIPAVVYAVTLAPPRRIRTPVVTVSLHRVAPAFFFGFEFAAREGAKIAVPEKALVDFLYLRPARSHRFRALPELELPRAFSVARARRMARRIRALPRRTMVLAELDRIAVRARPA